MSRGSKRPGRRRTGQLSARDAAVFDAEVVPRFLALFEPLLLDPPLPQGDRLQILDARCCSGHLTLELLRRRHAQTRIIAIDSEWHLLEMARERARGAAGRDVFFKTESLEELTFGDQVFDAVIGNLALLSKPVPDVMLREVARVLSPGGRVALAWATRGTFVEVFDMFREVALRRDSKELERRTDAIVRGYPTMDGLAESLRAAGFRDLSAETRSFRLSFENATALFEDVMLGLIALPEWRWIAGFDTDGLSVLADVQHAFEVYFDGGPIELHVEGGAFRGTV